MAAGKQRERKLRRRHAIDPLMTDEEIANVIVETVGRVRVQGVAWALEKRIPRPLRLTIDVSPHPVTPDHSEG